MDLILASASPRRRDLLALLGLAVRQIPADVDESLPEHTPLRDAVRLLAVRKAQAVAAHHPQSLVLAADTLVSVYGSLLTKPRDAADAQRMLHMLSGTTHTVATGFCLCRGDALHVDVVATKVTMHTIDVPLLTAYIASGEPFGKAGAYAIQGKGAALIKHIDGDFFNVVGLPLAALTQALRQFGETDFLRTFAGQCHGIQPQY